MICGRCGADKHKLCFSGDGRGGFHPWCRECEGKFPSAAQRERESARAEARTRRAQCQDAFTNGRRR